MTSLINTTNLDSTFPVAGQNNDSQGFRDNFDNTKINLNRASLEITELQDKCLFKSKLVNSDLNNDLDSTIIYRAQLKAPSETFNDIGTRSGVVLIDYQVATFQKLTLNGNVAIALTNFPMDNQCGKLRLWITVPNISYTILLPNEVIYGTSDSRISSKTLTFTSPGDYIVEFISVDGGMAYWIVFVA